MYKTRLHLTHILTHYKTKPMSYKNNMAQKKILHVTKRYKILKSQDDQLKELEAKLHIPPSAFVRLALECLLPKLSSMNINEDGLLNLWNTDKF